MLELGQLNIGPSHTQEGLRQLTIHNKGMMNHVPCYFVPALPLSPGKCSQLYLKFVSYYMSIIGLCLGWKGQLICWREGRDGKGGWGREGGEGIEGGWGEREDGGEGGEGTEGGWGEREGWEGEGEGEGRGGEGRDDGYTYCNRYVH